MRAVLAIVVICFVSVAILGGRYLAFEYRHGDREMVLRLFDRLS